MIGALAFHRFVGARMPGDGGEAATEEARRVGYWAAVIVFATIPYRVVVQAKGLAFEGDPWQPMIPRILATSWGHAMIWQGAAAFIAAVSFVKLRARHPHHWTHARVMALVLAIVPAFTGHASAVESWRWGAIANDALHVVAAGAWAGGLAVLTRCAWSLRATPEGGSVIGGFIDRFHILAQRSVAALVLTGLISTTMHLRTFADLTGSPYGATLLCKLTLVAIAVALGYRHSKTGATQARAGQTVSLANSLALEWLVMIAILLTTGLLAGSPPPGTD